MSKPILCLDFDGVCHHDTSDYQGVDIIRDGPVAGLFEFLEQASEEFEIHIYSARSSDQDGRAAMMLWFKQHHEAWRDSKEYEPTSITPVFPTAKPPAMVFLDDRALTFKGTWPDVARLRKFKPWHK